MALKLEYMKDELISMYQSGKSVHQISKEIDEYPQPISTLLKKYGVFELDKHIKSYEINEFFFHKIDTETKAYYLGFIAADGALVSNGAASHQLTISLKKDDIQILEGLKREMGSTHPIQFLQRNQVRFAIMRSQITEDLMNLGVIPNKSLTLEPILPKLDEEMKSHFLRGFFDGNGSIFSTRTGRKDPVTGIYDHLQHYVSIRATEAFLQDLRLYTGIEGSIKFNTGTHIWRFGAKQDIAKFKEIIYSNASIYLKRKYDKFPR